VTLNDSETYLSTMARVRRRRRRLLLVLALALAAGAAGAAVALQGGTDTRGARVVDFTVKSRLVGRPLHEEAVIPAGAGDGERRPLLVWLHGRSGHPGDLFTSEFYEELSRLGDSAPIVVALDGGDHSYWHDRRGGRWGSYVMREALPAALHRLPADPHRVAIGGISMGGFGALELARANPGRFCAAGGHSPAIWTDAGTTAPGAFDDAADFSRHDVVAYARTDAHPFGGIPLWIDRGNSDPFVSGDAALVGALRSHGANVTLHAWPGSHETAYWRAHTAAYLRFYARALARCRR
jgi:S-formylglutathione hydrolase FrmB